MITGGKMAGKAAEARMASTTEPLENRDGRPDSRIVPTFHVDSRDEELGSLNRIEVRQQRAELLAERNAIQKQIRRDGIGAEDLELRAVACGDLTSRDQTTASELRRQQPVCSIRRPIRVIA